MIAAAADMLAQHGLNVTSIRELARRACAPLGSTYHHFPQGKQQLVEEAVTYAGQRISSQLTQQLQAGALPGLKCFFATWRNILMRSHFHAGCPVLAVVTEEPLEGEHVNAVATAATVFDDWQQLISESLISEGVARKQARDLAALIVASLEGALPLCRAGNDIEPFDRVVRQLEFLLRQTIKSTGT